MMEEATRVNEALKQPNAASIIGGEAKMAIPFNEANAEELRADLKKAGVFRSFDEREKR